jgi:hypothetical protein
MMPQLPAPPPRIAQVRISNDIDRPGNTISIHNLVIQLVRNVEMWDHTTHFDEQVVNLNSSVCLATRRKRHLTASPYTGLSLI